uniref:MADS-box domain-containing protein n=1 Tax=Kalanchoe fedtschenkoi TaxID=63787 RepID=A0A7N0U7S7_KALFE
MSASRITSSPSTMTRQKVKLAFITNDSARKATYKKRKRGLIKKVNELSTLCGVDACAVIYSPYETQPEVWPPSAVGVQRVLAQFRRMPEMEQSKKMVNQETFLRQRIVKTKEQLKKQLKDNREKEVTEVMFQCLTGKGMANLNMMDLNDLAWLIDQYMREINNRCEKLKKSEVATGLQASGAGGAEDLVEEDTKPLILDHVSHPSMMNNSGVHHAAAGDGRQGSAWLPGGFVSNNNGASSSSSSNKNNHLQLQVLPGIMAGTDMILAPPQVNMGGMWPHQNPNFYNNM